MRIVCVIDVVDPTTEGVMVGAAQADEAATAYDVCQALIWDCDSDEPADYATIVYAAQVHDVGLMLIRSDELERSLRRVAAGEDPATVMLELYANSEGPEDGEP